MKQSLDHQAHSTTFTALLFLMMVIASCRGLNSPTIDAGMTGGQGGQGTSSTGGQGAMAGATVVSTGGGGATGGVAATGGMVSTGGTPGTAGAATGGTSPPMGGASGGCQQGDTKCAGTAGMQTCVAGQWQPATECVAHQYCLAKKCECIPDGLCSLIGATCSGMRTVVACAQDAQGCFYQASSVMCGNHQFCMGAAGKAACACRTDLGCTAAGNACFNGDSIDNCMQDGQGCFYRDVTTNCNEGEFCARKASGCLNAAWTQWPLPPATGGSTYRNNGDGTTTDTITGLMWAQESSPSTMTWDAAKGYCNTLGPKLGGGYTDWRLPTRIELLSLVDYGKAEPGPTINTTYFPGAHGDAYWTLSRYAAEPFSLVWLVDFKNGMTSNAHTPNLVWARCVR